jgi:nitrogen-specific signal transduction histidine kinase
MNQLLPKVTICFLQVDASLTEKIYPLLDNKYNIVSSSDTNEILTLVKNHNQHLIIILGSNVENPIHIAISIHNICYLLPVFILALSERLCDLHRELQFNPFANTQIHLLSIDNWQNLPTLLNNSLELAENLKKQITQLNDAKATIKTCNIINPTLSILYQQMEIFPFGVVISDLDGIIYYANEQACSLCNLQKTTKPEFSILDLFHNDEHIKLSCLILDIKDYLFFFLANISQKVKAELQLIYQTLETEAIINAIPTAILCVNKMGRIKYLNASAEKIFNPYYTTSIKGKHLEEVLPFMKTYSSIIDNCLREKDNKLIEGVTSEIFGTDQFVDIHLSPYFYHDFSGVLIKFDNITDRLTKIEDKIKIEKSISLAYLSIGIAHSINNPLSGITIAITNINNRLFKKDPNNIEIAASCGCTLEQIECYMNKQNIVNMHKDMLEQIHRISSIIKNTLFFGSTSIQRPMDYYNINVIIKNAIYMAKLERDINKNLLLANVSVIEESSNNLPLIKCNHTEISLVLLHLLKNAAESLAKVDNLEQQKTIHVKTYIKNEICYIEVEDNGLGIKVRNHNQLFEPFFSTDCKLAGLGLAICHSIIVHHHKGNIYPKKNISPGAVFVIELPIFKLNNTE